MLRKNLKNRRAPSERKEATALTAGQSQYAENVAVAAFANIAELGHAARNVSVAAFANIAELGHAARNVAVAAFALMAK